MDNQKNLKDFLVDTSYQQILKFLSDHPHEKLFDREIAQKTKLSRGAANIALRNLSKKRLIILEKKGRMSFYSVDLKSPIIRQWKVVNNILEIYPLIEKFKKLSNKIILFGSAAEGTNIKESDMDLFLISEFPHELNKIAYKSKRRIQLIIKTPSEFLEFKEKEPLFFDEVMKGITLWERI